MKGDPGMINLILNTALTNNNKRVDENKQEKRYNKIVTQQNATGWNQVLQGRVTKLIVQNHDKWRELNNSKMDGEQ